mmetsp:Transcript_33404/g.73867  ORF Transcript_33404/g.73867 Transcript_33404/m.73867 type:complete len:309 (-) Transcript_33404:96-1022(-)
MPGRTSTPSSSRAQQAADPAHTGCPCPAPPPSLRGGTTPLMRTCGPFRAGAAVTGTAARPLSAWKWAQLAAARPFHLPSHLPDSPSPHCTRPTNCPLWWPATSRHWPPSGAPPGAAAAPPPTTGQQQHWGGHQGPAHPQPPPTPSRLRACTCLPPSACPPLRTPAMAPPCRSPCPYHQHHAASTCSTRTARMQCRPQPQAPPPQLTHSHHVLSLPPEATPSLVLHPYHSALHPPSCCLARSRASPNMQEQRPAPRLRPPNRSPAWRLGPWLPSRRALRVRSWGWQLRRVGATCCPLHSISMTLWPWQP